MYLATLREFLGLRRNILVLLGAILTLGLGQELWIRFMPNYLHALGASALAIGLYGTLKDLLDAIYNYPGGLLTDRWGQRRALVFFNLLTAIGFAIYLVSPAWQWILVGLLLAQGWSGLSVPAIFSLIGETLPTQRRAIGIGVQSIFQRVPILIAPPLGGALLVSLGILGGIRAALALSIGLAVIATWVQHRFYEVAPPSSLQVAPHPSSWPRLDPSLQRLLLSDILARMGQGLSEVFIVVYALGVVGIDAFQFGLLVALRMFTSIALYIPFATWADRAGRPPFVALTFVFFAAYPWGLALARDLVGLALAFVLYGLTEIGEPARKALIIDLAAPERRGQQVGLYYLLRGLAVFPASLIGGLLYARISAQAPFWASGAVAGVGALLFVLWGRRVRGAERV